MLLVTEKLTDIFYYSCTKHFTFTGIWLEKWKIHWFQIIYYSVITPLNLIIFIYWPLTSLIFFLFFIRVFFHRHWQRTGQQGKGGDHLLFPFILVFVTTIWHERNRWTRTCIDYHPCITSEVVKEGLLIKCENPVLNKTTKLLPSELFGCFEYHCFVDWYQFSYRNTLVIDIEIIVSSC